MLIKGPGGDGQGTLVDPSADLEYQALAARLASGDTDAALLEAIGLRLFRALFQGDIGSVYTRGQGKLAAGEGLRLTFDIAEDALAIAALPWELLKDPNGTYIALTDASIMRYVRQQAVVDPLKTNLPLKILLTGAQSAGRERVAAELAAVKGGLADLGKEAVEITIEQNLTLQKLQPLLGKGFHVWHFVGASTLDASGEVQLLFEDEHSDDPGVIGRHLDQARQAGIDVLACSWDGQPIDRPPSQRLGKNCHELLRQAPAYGIQVALFLDSGPGGPFGLYTPDSLAGALATLQQEFFPNPAYFRIDGKPVVFFWQAEALNNAGGLGNLDAWKQLRDRVDPDRGLMWFGGSDKVGYLDVFDAMFFFDISYTTPRAAMTSYANRLNPYNRAHGTNKPFIATVMAGYDDLLVHGIPDDHCATDDLWKKDGAHCHNRGNGTYYATSWQAAIDRNPAAVIISTFNEFYEGSFIEPSQTFGRQYLDLTQEWVRRYKGR